MACLSCAERAQALREARDRVKSGDLKEALEPLKYVVDSGVRDLRSSLSNAAAIARTKLSGGRRG